MIFFATKKDLEKVQSENLSLRQRLYSAENKLSTIQNSLLLPETGKYADIIPLKRAVQLLIDELGYTLVDSSEQPVKLVKKV